MENSQKLTDGRKNNGKPKGRPNRAYYKWDIIVFDKVTNQLKSGKFSTITELNETLGLNLNNDLAYRLHTGYRADKTCKCKDNSFLIRYGHIKLNKIKESRNI